MKRSSSAPVSVSLGVLAGLILAGTARADCGLPICDMPKAIAKLRDVAAEGSDARSKARSDLLSQYLGVVRLSTDPAALANVFEYATAARALVIELREQPWVINAAKALYSDAVYGMAKYSPLQSETVAKYFGLLSYEQTRYEVIQHWSERIRSLETHEELMELGRLLVAMQVRCLETDDNQFVQDALKSAETLLQERTLLVQPFYEGVYEAKLVCAGADSEACRGHDLVDRITVLNMLGSEGLQMTFASSLDGVMAYAFSGLKTVQGGTVLTALSVDGAGLPGKAELEAAYDFSGRSMKGTIRTPDRLIEFTAIPVAGGSPIEHFNRSELSVLDQIRVRDLLTKGLRGTAGKDFVTLRATVFTGEEVGGTLTRGERSAVSRTQFQFGKYLLRKGIVQLVARQGGGGMQKIVLVAVPQSDGGITFEGLSFSSSNGKLKQLHFRAGE